MAEALLQVGQMQGAHIPLILAGLLIQADVLELEYHAQLAGIRGAVQLGPLGVGTPGLTHGNQTFFAERFRGQLPQELMEPGAVVGDAQVGVFRDLVDDIQAEALHALLHPEADGLVQIPAQIGIFPVQVRLLHSELVEVILLKLRDVSPGGAAEGSPHLIGRGDAVAVAPDVVIMVGVILTFQSLPEPEMLVGGVVQHQIQNDGDAALFGFPDQLFHIGHIAEHGINGTVVGNVVAVVHLGGGADGRHPDAVNA